MEQVEGVWRPLIQKRKSPQIGRVWTEPDGSRWSVNLLLAKSYVN